MADLKNKDRYLHLIGAGSHCRSEPKARSTMVSER